MSIKEGQISISDIQIQVVRKDIKNMHLAVYPPEGRVRISAPANMQEEAIRIFAITKLPWIKREQQKFREQARETAREYVSGESHYFQGRRYLLHIIEHTGHNKIILRGHKHMDFYVKRGSTFENRRKALQAWYRRELRKQIPELLAKWEDRIGVKASDCRVKIMRTMWGSCNPDAQRIWLNLELAKKPYSCLEYILVHELVHLLERTHNERFVAYMDRFLPDWRLRRDELNSLPVRHEDWGY